MAESISRELTRGELRYAYGVFRAAIRYGEVKIHNETAYWFQPSDTAITPNGEIYFAPESYKEDFSTNRGDMAWLIHEMTHCWQHQQGMWVKSRRLAYSTYEYGDLSASTWTLIDYGIEQQASIVEDYFKITHGYRPSRGTGQLKDYIRVIPFLPGK